MKNKLIAALSALILLIGALNIGMVFSTLNLNKQLENVKFELVRIHNEVNNFTADDKLREVKR